MIMLSKQYKSILWKRTQHKRDSLERKYVGLFKTVLNREFKMLADKIDSTNYNSESVLQAIEKEPIERLFIDLYKTVGVVFAKDSFNQLKAESQDLLFKEDKTDSWYEYLKNYAKVKAGTRITSITGETKKQAVKLIRTVLELSVEEGWGADVTARAIKKSLVTDGIEINTWRALRIARTEIVTASNAGTQLGAESLGVPLEKYWIATYDSRTRDTHLVVEQQNPKSMDEGFRVGEYLMEIPGDPDGGPEEVINCRCTIAHKVKGI
jgi:hypothetical protein